MVGSLRLRRKPRGNTGRVKGPLQSPCAGAACAAKPDTDSAKHCTTSRGEEEGLKGDRNGHHPTLNLATNQTLSISKHETCLEDFINGERSEGSEGVEIPPVSRKCAEEDRAVPDQAVRTLAIRWETVLATGTVSARCRLFLWVA